MRVFKKFSPLLQLSFIVLLMITACSEVKDSSSNEKEVRLETNNSDFSSNAPSDAVSTAFASDEHEQDVDFGPIVLFKLTDEDLNKQVSEIPYYSFGNIEIVTKALIQSVAEGHSPWRGSSVDAAQTLTQNLMPRGISDEQVKYSVVQADNQNQVMEKTVVDMNVPYTGVFRISIQYPLSSGGIGFITEIMWLPESSKTLHELKEKITEPLVIYKLREENMTEDTVKFPYYSNGSIHFKTSKDIQSLDEELLTPDFVARSHTSNLIPDNIPLDSVEYKTTNKNGELAEVTVGVPAFGVFGITMSESNPEMITKITFNPQ